jgi:hypothetical protein
LSISRATRSVSGVERRVDGGKVMTLMNFYEYCNV